MKALTICQPYAQLIIDRRKMVENRSWSTAFRGTMYVHAGKSTEWLCQAKHSHTSACNYGYALDAMPMGMVVGTVDVVDCIWAEAIWKPGPNGDRIRRTYPWLQGHEHTNGPWCWILARASKLPSPVPWRGAMGLFDIHDLGTAPQQGSAF